MRPNGPARRDRIRPGVEYTLARDDAATWDVAGPEAACAATRVAADTPARDAGPRRIVLFGDSAGGQLAVSVGYHAATGHPAILVRRPLPDSPEVGATRHPSTADIPAHQTT